MKNNGNKRITPSKLEQLLARDYYKNDPSLFSLIFVPTNNQKACKVSDHTLHTHFCFLYFNVRDYLVKQVTDFRTLTKASQTMMRSWSPWKGRKIRERVSCTAKFNKISTSTWMEICDLARTQNRKCSHIWNMASG